MNLIKKEVYEFPAGVSIGVKDLQGVIDPCDKMEYEEKKLSNNVLYESQHTDSMTMDDIFLGYRVGC